MKRELIVHGNERLDHSTNLGLRIRHSTDIELPISLQQFALSIPPPSYVTNPMRLPGIPASAGCALAAICIAHTWSSRKCTYIYIIVQDTYCIYA